MKPTAAFPVWLRRPVTFSGQWAQAKALVSELGLHTVCQEARCPNLGECWSHGNVSFMILGERCTRRCSFCAVETAKPEQVDLEEPHRLAQAVERLGLKYAVITSVARDDLKDEGASHFAACVRAIREQLPEVLVEVLTPDFHARPELIEQVVESCPTVFNHNLETVSRLSKAVRPQADYRRSLKVLELAKELGPAQMKTKSGLMVGLGEAEAEIRQALRDLRQAGVEILTIGQYLQPTPEHAVVKEFVTISQFEKYRHWAQELGFTFVASGPYVRSSYNAFEAFGES